MIFGEGITNDAVGIILFHTVVKFSGPGQEFTATVPLEIILEFLKLSFLSLLIGILTGILSALMYKKARIMTLNTIMECVVLFSFAYLSYTVAEILHLSGIIALLSCGVMMGHYTWYNLSP